MFNLTPEYHEFPFPHIIIRDFITEKGTHDFLRHNTDLVDYFEESTYGNLERIELTMGKKNSGTFTNTLPNKRFDAQFNAVVMDVLDQLENNEDLDNMVREHFVPVFKDEYGDSFFEEFNNKTFTYGAYNGCDEAKNLIGWHLDQGDKLVVGFVYLRERDDTADDGHLYISSGDDIQKEFKYEDNVLVLWPNLPNAWHKAGVRYPTENLRRIINIVYKTNGKVYHDYRTPRGVGDVNELYSNKKFGFIKVDKL
jgi:hypothetical protein